MYSAKLLNAYTKMAKLLQPAPEMPLTLQILAPPPRVETLTQNEKPEKNRSPQIPAQPLRVVTNNQHKIRKIKNTIKHTSPDEPAFYNTVTKRTKLLIKINAPTIVNSPKPPSFKTATINTSTTYATSPLPLNISPRAPEYKEKLINYLPAQMAHLDPLPSKQIWKTMHRHWKIQT